MRIPEIIRDGVAFIAYKGTDELMHLAGTAFFVAVTIDEPTQHTVTYTVTARHILDKLYRYSVDKVVYVRVNVKEGGYEFLSTSLDAWMFRPDNDPLDVAIIQWRPDLGKHDFKPINRKALATDDIVFDKNIGIGDEVISIGLFHRHSGTRRNLPVARVGNIAMMPEEPIQSAHGSIDGYVIESRSFGGLSGSPVYVYLSGYRPKRQANDDLSYNINLNKGEIFLLGLVHGHWNEAMPSADTLYEDAAEREELNLGMAIVIPAQRINEMLDLPEFVAFRERVIREKIARNSPTLDDLDGESE